MTTFKNNAKYAELLFTYLDVADRDDIPLSVPEVLRAFPWRFKGGSLDEAARGTRLRPETSGDFYPNGYSQDIADEWPDGRQAVALRRILTRRRQTGKIRGRGVMARIGTYQVLLSDYGASLLPRQVFTGMKSIYYLFGRVWDWSKNAKQDPKWKIMMEYSREVMIGACSPSFIHLPTAERNRQRYEDMLAETRVPALMTAILQVKDLIREMGSKSTKALARKMGQLEAERWERRLGVLPEGRMLQGITDPREKVLSSTLPLGPVRMRIAQECLVYGAGELRYALSKSDVERLHQVLMSAASAIVGVCVQACVGTEAQRLKSRLAVKVADANISRVVASARLVPLGDEVLICKGYRRAYTAHLGWLAGPLCREEYSVLVTEAESTAERGVLDVVGFLQDLRSLDAASSLNAAKVFKICPAPDVSPGTAMMDRIKQIGDGNEVDPDMMPYFEEELRTQILRAYIRSYTGRLKLRVGVERPTWFGNYLKGEMDQIPSADIHRSLAWEGTAQMPEISKHDPTHWKDSGLGADSMWEAESGILARMKRNMLTRLVFDDDCPMPGSQKLNDQHVIKMFVKAEGHKDPARAIFSANLTDRQAQSWMEKGVEQIAIKHPSYMIGQEVDVREARVVELTAMPKNPADIALFYSFDISGWSAKMPAEPQRISHNIWASLYGGHLFSRATEINEGARIYMDLDGYWGWYDNTHSNLEGFNGKEMTMILIALLSLSVKRWREKVVEAKIMSKIEADYTSALLFAYIDDGLCRIDLPRRHAVAAFNVYKSTVIETFAKCGYSVEVSKCFPSDRFAIFLNEVYLAGRHVVHGVRAAMGISAEPTERHTSLVERVTSVATGCRGAVMAGLNPLSATLLMSYHVFMHILEWVHERDPIVLAIWSLAPRTWGGLGLPNTMQLYVSGSGSAFEEGVATLQTYAQLNFGARNFFRIMCRSNLEDRTAAGVLTAPLSGRISKGYMSDNRVSIAVRKALSWRKEEGKLSRYAERLLRYANSEDFAIYANAIIPLGSHEVLQEQMLVNLTEAHPHSIFSAFAKRLEKSTTVMSIVGKDLFLSIVNDNRKEAAMSVDLLRSRVFV